MNEIKAQGPAVSHSSLVRWILAPQLDPGDVDQVQIVRHARLCRIRTESAYGTRRHARGVHPARGCPVISY